MNAQGTISVPISRDEEQIIARVMKDIGIKRATAVRFIIREYDKLQPNGKQSQLETQAAPTNGNAA